MKKRVAINGFGRIGRCAARVILEHDDLELVAINDPSDPDLTAHLFAFDTNFGRLPYPVSVEDGYLVVGDKRIRNFTTRDVTELPWGDLDIDVVLECTGVFRTLDKSEPHIAQGAKKILLSAPAKSEGFTTIVLGVNDDTLTGDEVYLSNASCTTNCLSPVAKVIDEAFGIERGFMTTVHSYTNDQRILDTTHKDMRRARAAAQNIIPTTTGAAKAVGLVLPHLKGKLNGISIRVPSPTVSIVDLVAQVRTAPESAEAVNATLKAASDANPHILGFETRPLVSSDYKMDSRSSIVDADQTMVIDNMVKVVAWYDNEWGYSNRLVELAAKVA